MGSWIKLAGFILLSFVMISGSSLLAEELTRVFNRLNLNKRDLHDFVRITVCQGDESCEKAKDEFEIDLNDDGMPEYFIGVLCGNGGCEYHCFENIDDQKFKYIGPIFLQRGGFEILKTKHHRFSDILSYSHTSATTGTLTRYEFDGHQYRVRYGPKEVSSSFFELLRPATVK